MTVTLDPEQQIQGFKNACQCIADIATVEPILVEGIDDGEFDEGAKVVIERVDAIETETRVLFKSIDGRSRLSDGDLRQVVMRGEMKIDSPLGQLFGALNKLNYAIGIRNIANLFLEDLLLDPSGSRPTQQRRLQENWLSALAPLATSARIRWRNSTPELHERDFPLLTELASQASVQSNVASWEAEPIEMSASYDALLLVNWFHNYGVPYFGAMYTFGVADLLGPGVGRDEREIELLSNPDGWPIKMLRVEAYQPIRGYGELVALQEAWERDQADFEQRPQILPSDFGL